MMKKRIIDSIIGKNTLVKDYFDDKSKFINQKAKSQLKNLKTFYLSKGNRFN